MTLAELLGITLRLRVALALGLAVAFVSAFLILPRAIQKLKGAGIVGRDRNKPDRPEVAEMGGLGVFIAFNVGVFAILALGNLQPADQAPVFACLVVAAGACITGVVDDLVVLRQRFKAFIPFVFAAPLSLYIADTSIELPHFGGVQFGLLYPLVLVPLGIACASNGFNILEGFNGLGAGLGLVLGTALSLLAILKGNLTGLALLFPLIGALGGFLWFNMYPAQTFPGDTGTLFIGAALAAGAILSKLEFWGALLFVPHIVEFVLKATAKFDAQSFASRVEPDGTLVYDGKVRSIPHIVMKRWRVSEPRLVAILVGAEAAWAAVVVALAVTLGGAGPVG
jgi:UDP-N-acetylglucosamine--dolichyl-phosphate N-acetylglucosaminephosphotransferase